MFVSSLSTLVSQLSTLTPSTLQRQIGVAAGADFVARDALGPALFTVHRRHIRRPAAATGAIRLTERTDVQSGADLAVAAWAPLGLVGDDARTTRKSRITTAVGLAVVHLLMHVHRFVIGGAVEHIGDFVFTQSRGSKLRNEHAALALRTQTGLTGVAVVYLQIMPVRANDVDGHRTSLRLCQTNQGRSVSLVMMTRDASSGEMRSGGTGRVETG